MSKKNKIMKKLEVLELLAKFILGYFLAYMFFDFSDTVYAIVGFVMLGLSIWGLIAKE